MKKLLIAAAIGIVTLQAQAATEVTWFNFPATVQSPTEINQTGWLSTFNTSLGTLTGAILNLNSAGTFTLNGTNSGSGSSTAIISANSDISFTSTLAALNSLLAGDGASLNASSGVQNYAAGQTLSFTATPTWSSDSDLSGVLSSLETNGNGLFSITGTSLSGLEVVGGGGNISASQTTNAGFGAQIIYTYDPTVKPSDVPEPSSVALLGLGLLAVYAARRRAHQS